MKKIGKEILFLSTDDNCPRMGEGAFIKLNDSSIMLAYTKYYKGSGDDHDPADIVYRLSFDQGESFGDEQILFKKTPDQQNIMSLSFLRMKNGDLGVFYAVKAMKNGTIICKPVFRRSSDEGKSWSDPVWVIKDDGYFVLNNDRIERLSNGRIMLMVADHSYINKDGSRRGLYQNELGTAGRIALVCSEDDGKTFTTRYNAIVSPYNDSTGFQEPGLFETSNGDIFAYCRTAYGCQYQSISRDGGKTFPPAIPNFMFTSPDSPMKIKKIADKTVAVFNPLGYNCLRRDVETWKSPKRTPLVCAVTDDDSLFDSTDKDARNGGFDRFTDSCYFLEDDMTNSYCYPSLLEIDDGFLVAYYHSNGTPQCLKSLKVTKVLVSELKK